MFKEMHSMDSTWRAMDLAGKMVERRRQSLATRQRPTVGARIARMLSALTVVTRNRRAEGRA